MSKLPRPCAQCDTLTRNGSKCSNCQAKASKAREASRPSATERGYDSTYRANRKVVLANARFCHWCNKPGTMVCDHVLPLNQGGTSELSNLVGACIGCNNKRRGMTPSEWNAYVRDELRPTEAIH